MKGLEQLKGKNIPGRWEQLNEFWWLSIFNHFKKLSCKNLRQAVGLQKMSYFFKQNEF